MNTFILVLMLVSSWLTIIKYESLFWSCSPETAWQMNQYVWFIGKSNTGYSFVLPPGEIFIAPQDEGNVAMMAHEVRHLWQMRQPRWWRDLIVDVLHLEANPVSTFRVEADAVNYSLMVQEKCN